MDTYSAVLAHRYQAMRELKQCEAVLALLATRAREGVVVDLNELADQTDLPLETILHLAGCDVEVVAL